jgi:heat shock protein HslJ
MGTSWNLASYGDPSDLTSVREDTAITLEFGDDGQAKGDAGCNGYFGTYTAEGGVFKIGPPVGSTRMACEEPLMDQELAYLRILEAATAYESVDNRLHLSTPDGQTLIFEVQNGTSSEVEAASLMGTSWSLASYGDPSDLTSVREDTAITLEFGDDGQAKGNAGCNGYFGTYTAEGGVFKIGPPVGSTMMACEEPLMDQELAYLRILEAATAYESVDDRLHLSTPDGQTLIFEVQNGTSDEVGAASACVGSLPDAPLVFVVEPRSGQTVSSGFAVSGCSRTFESTVNWRLLDRAGVVLVEGFATGGGVDGPGRFDFTVTYVGVDPQIGHLEVFEVDASGGEGFPPPRDVVPLVLR